MIPNCSIHPTNLMNLDYRLRMEQYCKLHPYFERSIRYILGKFEYISFDDVISIIKSLIHDQMMNVMLKDFELGYSYIFLYQFTESGDSNQYFTHLFIHLLQLALDPKYHDHLQLYILEANAMDHVKYIIVDDAAYSGYQMRKCVLEVPVGDLYIVLVAASCNALKFIREGKSLDLEPNLPVCNISQIFVGKVFENLDLDPKTLYLEWDVVYESEGKLRCLLSGLISSDEEDKFNNTFYFQHKLADHLSLPILLSWLPNPSKVNLVLTKEEKLRLIPIDSIDADYWMKIERPDTECDTNQLYQLVPYIKPFYKDYVLSPILY